MKSTGDLLTFLKDKAEIAKSIAMEMKYGDEATAAEIHFKEDCYPKKTREWIIEHELSLGVGRNSKGKVAKVFEVEPGSENHVFNHPIIRVKGGESATGYRLLEIGKGVKHSEDENTVLGSGQVGTAKLIQDMKTGEFFVLKVPLKELNEENGTYKRKSNFTAEEAKREVELFNLCNDHLSTKAFCFPRINKKHSDEVSYEIVMPYIKGNAVKNLDENNAESFDAYNRLSCALSSMQILQNLHDKGYIHQDFHTGNIMYDIKTQQATMIDPGSAIKAEPDKRVEEMLFFITLIMQSNILEFGKGHQFEEYQNTYNHIYPAIRNVNTMDIKSPIEEKIQAINNVFSALHAYHALHPDFYKKRENLDKLESCIKNIEFLQQERIELIKKSASKDLSPREANYLQKKVEALSDFLDNTLPLIKDAKTLKEQLDNFEVYSPRESPREKKGPLAKLGESVKNIASTMKRPGV